MLERFTTDARDAVVRARALAAERGDGTTGCHHLLIGLAAAGEPTLVGAGITAADLSRALGDLAGGPEGDARALRAIGVDLASIRASVEATFGPDAWTDAAPRRRGDRSLTERLLGRVSRVTPAMRKSLELSLREAVADHARTISTTHVLRGILRAPGDAVPLIVPPATLDRLRAASRRAA